MFQALVEQGQVPPWSMGDDAPPAFLSSLPRPLWDYCKQRFAQVTNPPIDPLRESQMMSLDVYLGKDIKLNSPLLDAAQMDALSEALSPVHCIDVSFEVAGGVKTARQLLGSIAEEAKPAAPRAGAILLRDRAVGEKRAALPALLAVSAACGAVGQAAPWDTPLSAATGKALAEQNGTLLVAAARRLAI